MRQLLTKSIIKFFANLFYNITALIIVSAIGLPVLIAWATGTLGFLLQILKTPTPIWITIISVLLVFACLKIIKVRSSSKLHYKTKYFTINNYKWEVKIYDYGYFEIEKYPFCTIHDLRFIYGSNGKYCPGTENETCKNWLSEYDEFKVYESAKSIIENKIRNKKC